MDPISAAAAAALLGAWLKKQFVCGACGGIIFNIDPYTTTGCCNKGLCKTCGPRWYAGIRQDRKCCHCHYAFSPPEVRKLVGL
jgi:hypothetical protein